MTYICPSESKASVFASLDDEESSDTIRARMLNSAARRIFNICSRTAEGTGTVPTATTS